MKTNRIQQGFLIGLLFFLHVINASAQDCECQSKSNYDYIEYKGRHRTLLVPSTCDSLLSLVHINNYLSYGDIFYERASKTFGWQFIFPQSLVTTTNPDLQGAGTGRGGTGLSIGELGIDINGFDPGLRSSTYGLQNTIIHEGVHRWDFRGQNYFVGPDIAHPFNTVMDHIMTLVMQGGSIGQYNDISPNYDTDIVLKMLYRYYWTRYQSDEELNWNHYFDKDYSFEELETVTKPEAFERLSVQGGPLLSIYFMHGLDGLKSIFDAIEKRRIEDPEWQLDVIADRDVARDRYIRIFADALQVDVTPYFEYWKYPVSDELLDYLSSFHQSSKIDDVDKDGFSPLEGDFDDQDPTIFPFAEELIDGLDNNQDGQIDEMVLNETAGDFPGDGEGPVFSLPAFIHGEVSDLMDEDGFRLDLAERTRVNILCTSIRGVDVCELSDGNKLGLFSGVLEVDGGFLLGSEVLSGQNNNHWVGYLEAGQHRFRISTEYEVACPGEYEIRIFEAKGTPKTIVENGISYTTKVFDGLIPNPDFDTTGAIGVSGAEVQTLKNIYNHLGGENWENSLGWLSTSDVCYWEGLGCDRLGLSRLNMFEDRRLSGPLTSEMIIGMKNLRELRIIGSDFEKRPLPDAFQSWKNVSMISLPHNNIGGELPTTIAERKKLWYLDLESNQFEGAIPTEYASLKKLKYLNIMGNHITGVIPESFTQLTELETFYFDVDEVCAENEAVMEWLSQIQNVSPGYGLCSSTSLKDVSNAKLVRIHPNPAEDRLFVDLTDSNIKIEEIQIVNFSGARVLSSNDKEIDISGLVEGIYGLVLRTNKGQEFSKTFVKI